MRDFLIGFMRDYHSALAVRGDTFKALFQHMANAPLTIVETGCARQPGNWGGDGQSTLLFDRYVELCGGKFSSVDISPEAVRTAFMMVSRRTNMVLNDSIAYLSTFGQPIDVLYLDSFDLDQKDPFPSSVHHLQELCAAQRWLHAGSVVMVDDTYRDTTGACLGKGGLVAQYMKAVGAKLLAEGYQDVWLLP